MGVVGWVGRAFSMQKGISRIGCRVGVLGGCTEMRVLYSADDDLLLQSTHFQGLVASGSTEIAFCSSGAQKLISR